MLKPLLIGLLLVPALQAQALKAFTGATVIDGKGQRLARPATIVVRGGKIEAVGRAAPPQGAEVIDLSGKFVTPGLISTHGHTPDTLRQLGLFARYGVTTVWSLGGDPPASFTARDQPPVNRARVYVAGEVIVGKTADEARRMVAKVAAGKPDVIKIRVDDQLGTTAKMGPDVYRAIIDEAHKRGLRVAAHIFYLEDAKDLLRAGADIIAHSVRDKDIDSEFVRLMKDRSIPYIPTLTRELSTFVYESKPAFFSDPFFLRDANQHVVAQLQEPARQKDMRESKSAQAYKAALEVAKRNLKKAADAGLLIAMGTDSGATPSRFEGYFEHLEMEMMADAGMSPAHIIRSAASDAARAMKVESVGELSQGAWADFAVYDRDPLVDIRNSKSLSQVWIAGKQVSR